jgi:spermidine synthase
VVADGRRVLQDGEGDLDLVVVDTLLPESASSGAAYSQEFYELVRERLSEDGLFAQWVPTDRVLATAARAFPHVATVDVPSYASTFLVASPSPLRLDPDALSTAFDEVAGDFSDEQADRLRHVLATLELTCVRAGGPPPAASADLLNTDLHPLDEFFLNNPRPRNPPEPATSCESP